jgi:hypothetical protein
MWREVGHLVSLFLSLGLDSVWCGEGRERCQQRSGLSGTIRSRAWHRIARAH